MTAEWEQVLSEQPKILWGLVADIVKAAKAGEGEKRTGRRPAATVGSLDELYDVLFPPAYTTRPFPEALNKALSIANLTQRQMAEGIGCDQATISRLISGRSEPRVETIESIARVLNVRPTYFAEYRAMKLGQVVTTVLLANPALSAESVRSLIGATA